MPSKNVALKIGSRIDDDYGEYCKAKGLVASKQFESFIKEELDKKRSNYEKKPKRA